MTRVQLSSCELLLTHEMGEEEKKGLSDTKSHDLSPTSVSSINHRKAITVATWRHFIPPLKATHCKARESLDKYSIQQYFSLKWLK